MVSSARRAVYPRFHLITITIIIIIIFVIVVVLITITTTIIVIIIATVALYPRFHLITRDGEEDYAMGRNISGTSRKGNNRLSKHILGEEDDQMVSHDYGMHII